MTIKGQLRNVQISGNPLVGAYVKGLCTILRVLGPKPRTCLWSSSDLLSGRRSKKLVSEGACLERSTKQYFWRRGPWMKTSS